VKTSLLNNLARCFFFFAFFASTEPSFLAVTSVLELSNSGKLLGALASHDAREKKSDHRAEGYALQNR
jgi:hypothetical protein